MCQILLERLPIPRRQIFELVDFVIGQVVQEISDIGLGIEVIGLCRLDNGHDGGGVFSTTVRWDLMMPGVWELKSRSLILSTLCFAGLRLLSPISFTMAAVI